MVVWACNDLERERNVREGRIVWQGDLLARKVGRECGTRRGFDLSWTIAEVDLFFPEIARVREEGAPGHTNFFVEARTMLNLITGGQIYWRKRPYN